MNMGLGPLIECWAQARGLPASVLPGRAAVAGLGPRASRAGVEPQAIASWERRHGFLLPPGLRAWLLLSDGLYGPEGPLVHPLMAIGPMIPFARSSQPAVQPESWYELGNPGAETVCVDLAYRWPGGDFPIFSSGDDERGTRPRIVATGFDAWFLRTVGSGGQQYWLEPGFEALGDPWSEHRRHAPVPPLPARLEPLAGRAGPLLEAGADERTAAQQLGISHGDVEALFRHLQHRQHDVPPAAGARQPAPRRRTRRSG